VKCRHCGSGLTLSFLDLGSAPPSNAYLSHEALSAPETWYPLKLLVCESCWLVQTEDHAGREQLFTNDYAYFSSMSTSWLDHAKRYVGDMVQRLGLGPHSTVVEIAANDGYLLQYVAQAGIPCYGIEPTASTATAAKEKGLDILERFFGVELASQLASQDKQADLMVANNVLAHVPDINGFVSGFATLLKPHGVATFEFPHLLKMMAHNQFDTAYHEHYSYLSLTAVQRIFKANGLTVFDVQELPTHGGSLRVLAQRSDFGTRVVQDSVSTILSFESQAGLTRSGAYTEFQRKAEAVKDGLLAFLLQAKQQGLRVGAYGAAAKGNTLLNFAGVRPDLLPYVVDRSPGKQGKFMPGSRIPIFAPDHLWAQRPDVVLILPWNLKDEVMASCCGIRDWGGRFLISVPTLEVS
jgi:2-polyprenyl-3-methyl-5-hydroxy-6-metoxy-1,4-benzoquinol methylase